jgi:putative transposase
MYQELALEIYNLCCKERPVQKRFRFKSKLFIMDASVISLCLSLFPWAKYRTTKGAVKIHALLDWNGSLPAFMVITDGKVHDSHAAWDLPLEPGSIIVFDRGYLDYALLYHHHKKGRFFVTRLKKNSKWRRVASRKTDRKNGVLCDQDIRVIGSSAHKYPETLRRIRFRAEDGNVYEFLTNRFDLAASTIADIYKARWDVELFFKWIKQNLKIKSYLGTTENAVFTQIWIAICAYLMLSYHKFLSKSRLALSRILSLIQLYVFFTFSLDVLLHEKWKHPPDPLLANRQLSLEGF